MPFSDHLKIPRSVRVQILPDEKISVLELLKFELPNISSVASAHPVQRFFCQNDPTIVDPLAIRAIPIPFASTVKELTQACSSLGEGINSVTCLHVQSEQGSYLPLWVITYWAEAIELRLTWRDPWVRAEANLRKRNKVWKNEASANLITQVYAALSTLPWHGNIHGFDNEEPLYTLTTYLTQDWLSDIHANQMLDLLRHAVQLDPTKSKVEVENLQFIRTLQRAYAARHTHEYENARYFARPRRLGQLLATGVRDIVGLEANIRESHWVTMVVDFRNDRILYGDPFGDEPDASILDTITWWACHHTGHEFSVSALVTSHQTDTFSCGLLSWNALAHRLAPAQYALMDPKEVEDERIKVLLAIIKRHCDHNQVCSICLAIRNITLTESKKCRTVSKQSARILDSRSRVLPSMYSPKTWTTL
jgi:hypothetical protein